MSTFSGIGTALSALIAQRTALDVAGQNVANANTTGYTRQRAELTALTGAQVPSMFAASNGVGSGVRVTAISRAADSFLDARVRSQTSGAEYLAARADIYTTLEKSLGEPSTTGLASQLSTFWNDWHDVANSPDKSSARTVLLDDARQIADTLHQLYDSVGTQWRQTRITANGLVEQANALAAGVADLNARILATTVAGGNAHELADQRDLLVTQLSGLVGATAQVRQDGQIDVLVGGNALVFGADARALSLQGAADFAQATGDAAGVPPVPGQGVWLAWADRPDQQVQASGGRVAGLLTALAAPSGDGTGGMLTEAAGRLDEVARALVTAVNTQHLNGVTAGGAPGTEFFTPLGPGSAAAQIGVALTDPAAIAVAAAGMGANDGSIGRAIAGIGLLQDGPDGTWSAVVVEIGNRTAAARSRSDVAGSARASAEQEQLANASVDTDEEAMAMIAAQRAYEAAARVLTAIDEMLDTLINRTGVVGR